MRLCISPIISLLNHAESHFIKIIFIHRRRCKRLDNLHFCQHNGPDNIYMALTAGHSIETRYLLQHRSFKGWRLTIGLYLLRVVIKIIAPRLTF